MTNPNLEGYGSLLELYRRGELSTSPTGGDDSSEEQKHDDVSEISTIGNDAVRRAVEIPGPESEL